MMKDNMNVEDEKIIKIICPVCKTKKEIVISGSILSPSKNITTISIRKNEICEHHFQAFIDQDFKVRGYQKVDYEIDSKVKLPKGNFFMKVIVIGDYEVGKTAITRRFVENSFDERYLPTLQLKISKKKLNFGYTDVTLIIWDIGGQVIHMSPYRNQFYEGAQSAVIIVDRTRKKTIENAEKWVKDTNKAIPKKIPFILVGNKSDLNDDIVVSEQEIKNEADKLNLDYLLTSAKTGYNINELFQNLTYLFFESQNL